MGQVLRYTTIAALTFAIMVGVAGIYDLSLRDPRYLDGWMLFAGMALQLLFHVRKSIPSLSTISDPAWTQIHIVGGYVVLGAFAAHTSAALPNSQFEWALWLTFVLVVLSGIFGSYLMIAIPLKLEQHALSIEFDDIKGMRMKLARRLESLVSSLEDEKSLRTIWDMYTTTLRSFFNKPRNIFAHLNGSQLSTKRINQEIQAAELVVDEPGRKVLQSIKTLVAEKDRLDFQYANRGLLRMWTFVHVPATYGLIVLTLIHVAIVYAFSTGVP